MATLKTQNTSVSIHEQLTREANINKNKIIISLQNKVIDIMDDNRIEFIVIGSVILANIKKDLARDDLEDIDFIIHEENKMQIIDLMNEYFNNPRIEIRENISELKVIVEGIDIEFRWDLKERFTEINQLWQDSHYENILDRQVRILSEDHNLIYFTVHYLAHKKESGCGNATLSLVHASMEYLFKRHLKMTVLEDIKIPKKAKSLPGG